MMKSNLWAASLLALVVTTTFTVPAVAREAHAGAARDAYAAAGAVGREVPAPAWSAACMTDHGRASAANPCGSMAARQGRDK
jgi:hypothetical protein